LRDSDSDGIQRPQRLENDDVAALHVGHARAASAVSVQQFEVLERAVGLEHGIEMPDQQKMRARMAVAHDQVTGPVEFGAVDPFGLETGPAEGGREQLAHFPHTLEVERPAVDVHRALEQRQRLGLAGIDGLDQPLLGGRERGRALGAGQHRRPQREAEHCNDAIAT